MVNSTMPVSYRQDNTFPGFLPPMSKETTIFRSNFTTKRRFCQTLPTGGTWSPNFAKGIPRCEAVYRNFVDQNTRPDGIGRLDLYRDHRQCRPAPSSKKGRLIPTWTASRSANWNPIFRNWSITILPPTRSQLTRSAAERTTEYQKRSTLAKTGRPPTRV